MNEGVVTQGKYCKTGFSSEVLDARNTFPKESNRSSREKLERKRKGCSVRDKKKLVNFFFQFATQFFVARHVAKRGCYSRNFTRNLNRLLSALR